MSVRSYKINKIDYVEEESFNLWHDTKLMDFLEKEYDFHHYLNEDAVGVTELPVDALKRAINELSLEKELKLQLQKDIDWAEKRKIDYIQYYCL